jgi:hypothetical protein
MANMLLDDITILMIITIHELKYPVLKVGILIGEVKTLQEQHHLDRASYKHNSTMSKEPKDRS